MYIDSGPSCKLPTKYCDFTGFPALYRHKVAGNTGGAGFNCQGIRFSEVFHYEAIDKMQNNKIEDLLSQRKVYDKYEKDMKSCSLSDFI